MQPGRNTQGAWQPAANGAGGLAGKGQEKRLGEQGAKQKRVQRRGGGAAAAIQSYGHASRWQLSTTAVRRGSPATMSRTHAELQSARGGSRCHMPPHAAACRLAHAAAVPNSSARTWGRLEP